MATVAVGVVAAAVMRTPGIEGRTPKGEAAEAEEQEDSYKPALSRWVVHSSSHCFVFSALS
jgi:hypothetical protein